MNVFVSLLLTQSVNMRKKEEHMEENLSVIYQCAEDFLDVWCGLFAY